MEENINVVDTPVDETVEAEVTETEESTPEESNDWLQNLTYQYNKEEVTPKTVDEVKELLEMGKFYKEKGKAKLESFKEDPRIKKVEEWAKKSGFDSSDAYFKAVEESQLRQQRQSMAQAYQKQGMTQDVAMKLAEADMKVSGTESRITQLEKQLDQKKSLDSFVDWHKSMKESGVFSKEISSDIPKEVWFENEQGKPLEQAYLEYWAKNAKTMIEQDTLKSLNQPTTGSLEKESAPSESHETLDQLMTMLGKMSSDQIGKWVDKPENYAKLEKVGYFNK